MGQLVMGTDSSIILIIVSVALTAFTGMLIADC